MLVEKYHKEVGDMQTIAQAFEKLGKSKFRAKFHLSRDEKDWVREKGIVKTREHAAGIIKRNIAPGNLPYDGRQTPIHGHPVFVAQHATALCCRDCLYRWYRVPKDIDLSEEQQERLVNFLMAWIERELSTGRCDGVYK